MSDDAWVPTPFERGMTVARDLAVEHGVPLMELRSFAREDLSVEWPEGQGMTSSDVNHHLSLMGRSQPGVLRAECERLRDRAALVARVAASTGKSEAETLANLQALFAPADEDPGR